MQTIKERLQELTLKRAIAVIRHQKAKIKGGLTRAVQAMADADAAYFDFVLKMPEGEHTEIIPIRIETE